MRRALSLPSVPRIETLFSPQRRHRATAALAALLVQLLALPASADSRYGDETLPESVQAQLRQLLPQRPGSVDIYALVVGGDADDEVFRRETAAVRNALDARLGTVGRSVVLVNHRSQPAPEATFNSVRQVLHALARRMDPNEDVLWLHLTSHGAPDHALVLSYPNRKLHWLTASHLRKMLDEAGIRYRVVVVSACYSGGFVPPLAGPETLVATSSAASRKAYGCGNASQMTDFSRALYLKALPQTRSVPEAVRLPLQIIHQQEAADHVEHSYPQMRSGAAIETRLKELPLPRTGR